MTRPFFSRDRTSDFENFSRHADNIISQIKTRFKEGHAVDFQVRAMPACELAYLLMI